MNINDLSHEQRIALVALMEAVAMADGVVDYGEVNKIEAVADAIGDDEYRRVLDEAEKKFEDLESLKSFLTTITDQEARELIFGTVWEQAVMDPKINHEESELLDWLVGAWNIDIQGTVTN